MEVNTKKLISISSQALCNEKPILPKSALSIIKEDTLNDYLELLSVKNGFYAFESALHVFPTGCDELTLSAIKWNNYETWIANYEGVTDEYWFFGEDIFGIQFALKGETVFKFDPETAEFENFASSLEEWAKLILNDYEFETGFPLANEWQQIFGSIPDGKRLLPKIPFILGGEYSIDNLYVCEAVKGMNLRADIWKQIKNLPDGTKVKLNIVR